MFFDQVSGTTTSFTWRIIRNTSLLISITNVVFPIFKQWRYFLTNFCTSGIIPSFALLLGLSGSWILYFPVIEMSEVFFLLFLQGIRFWSGVTIYKLSPCTDITERLELYFLISISLGFSILVLLSDKLADEIDLDLFTIFTVYSVPVLWVYFGLSNDLPLSYLLLLDLSIFYLGCVWFICFVDCVNILFCNGRSDGFLRHSRFLPMSLIPYLKFLSVVVTNEVL